MLNNGDLKVYTRFSPEHKQLFESISPKLTKYFSYKNLSLKKNSIQALVESKTQIDILFISKEFEEEFKLDYYWHFQKINDNFIYVVVSDEPMDSDIQTFKDLADDIIHVANATINYLTWKFISILRRYWNKYSKPSTIIYKDIIADFVDQKIFINKENIELTLKEILVLKLFMHNIGKYYNKEEIYKEVWGSTKFNNSRSVDQILFRLKKKIGATFFHTKRSHGTKFE